MLGLTTTIMRKCAIGALFLIAPSSLWCAATAVAVECVPIERWTNTRGLDSHSSAIFTGVIQKHTYLGTYRYSRVETAINNHDNDAASLYGIHVVVDAVLRGDGLKSGDSITVLETEFCADCEADNNRYVISENNRQDASKENFFQIYNIDNHLLDRSYARNSVEDKVKKFASELNVIGYTTECNIQQLAVNFNLEKLNLMVRSMSK